MKMQLTTLVALGVVVGVHATPALADIYQLNEGSGFTSNDLLGSISYSGSPPISFGYDGVYVGPLNMNVVDQNTSVTTPYTVYCTDIFNDFNPGGLYTLSATSLTTQIAANIDAQIGNPAQANIQAGIKASQINALLGNTLPIAGPDGANGAAVQAAIWEIMNEPGVTGYSVATGLFQASVDAASEAAFSADVSTYLYNVSGTNGSNGTWQASDSNTVWEFVVAAGQNPNQSFSFIESSGGGNNVPLPTPEPASLSVLALGMVGLAGFRFRRRSTR
jgi:hypothetical protein